MEYSKLTINQQLATVRQQVQQYEQEHYNYSLQDLVNGGPTDIGVADGQTITSADRQKKLENGILLLNKEIARLESLLPQTEPVRENNTGIVDESNATP